jgi:hypothetical protein
VVIKAIAKQKEHAFKAGVGEPPRLAMVKLGLL